MKYIYEVSCNVLYIKASDAGISIFVRRNAESVQVENIIVREQ